MSTKNFNFILADYIASKPDKAKGNIIYILPTEESAIKAYAELKFYQKCNNDILYFPDYDTSPYDRTSPSINIMQERVRVLQKLASDNTGNILLILSASSLMRKVAHESNFNFNSIKLKVQDDCKVGNLIKSLNDFGFARSSTVIEPAEYAVRGEIIDITLSESLAVRINLAWDKVDSIKKLDTNSQSSDENLQDIEIFRASEIILNDKQIEIFKSNFLMNFGVNYSSHPFYESILNKHNFPGHEQFLPLFYNKLCSIKEFSCFEGAEIFYSNMALQNAANFEKNYIDAYEYRISSNKIDENSFYFALKPKEFIIDFDELKNSLKAKYDVSHINLHKFYDGKLIQENKAFIETAITQKIDINELLKQQLEINNDKIIIAALPLKHMEVRLENMLSEYNNHHPHQFNHISDINSAKLKYLNITNTPISNGFISEEYFIIGYEDLFGKKEALNLISKSKRTAKDKINSLLTEIDNIKEGDLIVHDEHGIGRFEHIVTLEVENIKHDCIKLIYEGDDILYLPVENLNLVKKYGNNEVALDKLGGVNWQKRKAKVKERIREIAGTLIKIQAQRQLSTGNYIEFNKTEYEKFCHNFPYNETDDQLRALEDIEQDFKMGKLIDRLICADVGFGKTEIAMRAAFMVASDMLSSRNQIAIICPTTILCKQHYHNFKERFNSFGYKVAQVSRLVGSLALKNVKNDLENGDIDIIIGTHALLSNSIKFKNLKMIIIDEEQHFGVAQKEKLKELKANIHVLSLSATPIPRTLQMSMVGIKDLSIMATPPALRSPVKTQVIQFDNYIIREALLREHKRGGRSFVVAPRISHIEKIGQILERIAPELSFKIAHGQMPAKQLDTIMSDFCDGKFDILLSTTIIESGIDIAAANTIIIYNSHMLGLSQLYQLRGRVGRSKVNAYAYLTLPKHYITNKKSLARLEILQNITELGAGFSIASHDMDLRGFGNLVGDEQSGQIKEVGVELYNSMIENAIEELKCEELNQPKSTATKMSDITINLNIPVFISDDYISDSSLRLAIYRRASELKNLDEIELFKNEMIDRFGAIPQEFLNLMDIVKLKTYARDYYIKSIDSGPSGFVFKFSENADLADKIMSFISKYPRNAKLKPDNKMIYITPINPENTIQTLYNILEKIFGK